MEGSELGSDPIKCECEFYDCQCRKQCFCKLQGSPVGGRPEPRAQRCPICKTCPNDMASAGLDSDSGTPNEPKGPAPAAHEFKCTCNFDGIGGQDITAGSPNNGEGAGGSMDCDCKVADCSCAKKCKCRTPAK